MYFKVRSKYIAGNQFPECQQTNQAVQPEKLEDMTVSQLADAVASNKAMGMPDSNLQPLQDVLAAKGAGTRLTEAATDNPATQPARRRGPLATSSRRRRDELGTPGVVGSSP